MPTLYIDTVANRFPRAGITDDRHCARYSAALVETRPGVATGTLARQERLIRPDNWTVADVVQPYLRATPEDFMHDAVSIRLAFEEITPLLRKATEIVAFNAPFHRRTLETLCRDNGTALIDFTSAPWLCLMSEAADMMKIKLESAGKWKSPKLTEAYLYFTGKPMEEKAEWDTFATQQVFALREIHREMKRRMAVV